MSLLDWCEAGLIQQHEPKKEEIENLLKMADEDLARCSLKRLLTDWKFIIAYTAALACANAALAASGYRTRNDRSPHENALDSLRFTIQLSDRRIAKLQHFRKKRHSAHYELAGSISMTVSDEMIAIARELRQNVGAWLAELYPGLIG